MSGRNQAQDAQDLYDTRAAQYDDSWHPRFARHMVELANIQPGEAVLDLACGTGLATFAASVAVGSSGKVVGVDVSRGMLAEAEAKKERHSQDNVEFIQHSITDLDTLAPITKGTFDVITCCAALVLLEHPVDALTQWIDFLKPGGRLAVDVTHIQNLTAGVIMERVGQRMARPLPWHRLNFSSSDDLRDAMVRAGFVDVDVTFLSQILHTGPEASEELEDYIADVQRPRVLREYGLEDADAVFDAQIDGTPMKAIASPPEVRARAKQLFCEEWRRAADADGKVREIDGVFVALGYKPTQTKNS